jgi:hypothetical protein
MTPVRLHPCMQLAAAHLRFVRAYRPQEDDTVFLIHSIARVTALYDPNAPIWLSAHGCEATYLPQGCLRENEQSMARECSRRGLPPRTCKKTLNRMLQRGSLLHGRLQTMRGPAYTLIDQHGRRTAAHANGTAGVTSNCGGLGCVFSRGLLHSLPSDAMTGKGCSECRIGFAG